MESAPTDVVGYGVRKRKRTALPPSFSELMSEFNPD
jgi:hypothetical protein